MIVYLAFEIPGIDDEDDEEIDDILDCLDEKVEDLGYEYWIDEVIY